MSEIKNARIGATMLGIEDHGIFSFMISFDYGGSGQGFGGCALDGWDKEKKRRYGGAFAIPLLRRILEVVGVEKWESLPGTPVRVEADFGHVARMGNLLNDEWVVVSELVDSYKEDTKEEA